jgi:hypothetical protein
LRASNSRLSREIDGFQERYDEMNNSNAETILELKDEIEVMKL